MEAAAISDIPKGLPDHLFQVPSIDDDGSKPPFTYAQLVGMAILGAPDRRLSLVSIRKWIPDSFQFYRNKENNWQKSIQSKLISNKAFEKQKHHTDDLKGGDYWTIACGYENTFMEARPTKRLMEEPKGKPGCDKGMDEDEDEDPGHFIGNNSLGAVSTGVPRSSADEDENLGHFIGHDTFGAVSIGVPCLNSERDGSFNWCRQF